LGLTRKSLSKSFIQWRDYLLLRLVLAVAAPLPFRALQKVGRQLGVFCWHVAPFRRRVVLENLRGAFGHELDAAGIRRLGRQFYAELGTTLLEFCGTWRLSAPELQELVTVEGREHLATALAGDRGALLVSGHFGNWELMSIASALKFGPGYVLARPLDFAPMDKVLAEIRSSTGNILVDKQDSANRVRQLLRDKQMLGILLDQNASWYEGVFVRFFGHPACTNKGLAMFALRYDTPIIPAYNIRIPDGRYEIIYEPPLTLIKTGNARHDILKNTALFNRTMENFIRKAPDHWFWVHRRWRIIGVPEQARDKMLIDDGIEVDLSQ